jgi:hypothetical protein
VSEAGLAILAVFGAYALLYVLWAGSRELAHSYGHWLEGIRLEDLPLLSSHALAFIGLDGIRPAAFRTASVLWALAAAWPALALVGFLRGESMGRTAILGLALMTWLLGLLTLSLLVAIGLWLPFSLL